MADENDAVQMPGSLENARAEHEQPQDVDFFEHANAEQSQPQDETMTEAEGPYLEVCLIISVGYSIDRIAG
jgi:hypothetical protein